ncbi:MAG: hypothetical protein AB1486_25220 [Planctomycetota bacterium]
MFLREGSEELLVMVFRHVTEARMVMERERLRDLLAARVDEAAAEVIVSAGVSTARGGAQGRTGRGAACCCPAAFGAAIRALACCGGVLIRERFTARDGHAG